MKAANSGKTRSVVVYTATDDSRKAGLDLGDQINAQLEGTPPDAVILFVSPKYDATALVACVVERSSARIIIGCSSAGEFTSDTHGDGRACAVAISSSSLQFAVGIGRGISVDRRQAAADMVRDFRCGQEGSNEYCSALILTDALAGHADELIEELTLKTGGSHQFFGGGAGDDANFRRTQVFVGKELASDAAVALEIISEKPIGIGVRHGWRPATAPMRVTEARGSLLVSLNASPILDIFREQDFHDVVISAKSIDPLLVIFGERALEPLGLAGDEIERALPLAQRFQRRGFPTQLQIRRQLA